MPSGRRGSPGPYGYGYGYDIVYRPAKEGKWKTGFWAAVAVAATAALFLSFTTMLGDMPGLIRTTSEDGGVMAKVYLSRQITDLKRTVSEQAGRYEAAKVASDQAWTQLDALKREYKMVHQRVSDLSMKAIALGKTVPSLSSSVSSFSSSSGLASQRQSGPSSSSSPLNAATTKDTARVLEAQNALEQQQQQWRDEIMLLKEGAASMASRVEEETQLLLQKQERYKELDEKRELERQLRQTEEQEARKRWQQEKDMELLQKQQRQREKETIMDTNIEMRMKEMQLQQQQRQEEKQRQFEQVQAELRALEQETETLKDAVQDFDLYRAIIDDSLAGVRNRSADAVMRYEVNRMVDERCTPPLVIQIDTAAAAVTGGAATAAASATAPADLVEDVAFSGARASGIDVSTVVSSEGVSEEDLLRQEQLLQQQQQISQQMQVLQQRLDDILRGGGTGGGGGGGGGGGEDGELYSQAVAAVEGASVGMRLDLITDLLSTAQTNAKETASRTAKEVVAEEIIKRTHDIDAMVADVMADIDRVDVVDVQSNVACIDEGAVKQMVQAQVAVFDADRTGKIDYAAAVSGGRIVHDPSLTSATFSNESWSFLNSDYLQSLGFGASSGGGPSELISANMQLGSCWAMQGQQGFVTVELIEPIVVTSITLQHISKYVALDLTSALKEFVVFGLQEMQDEHPLLLTSGVFDVRGNDVQTYPVLEEAVGGRPVKMVMLRVLSNHGNEDYTCIYRLRVHGPAAEAF